MPPSDLKRRMLGKYQRVTADRLAILIPAIEKLEPKASSPDAVASIKRELHTLKGEARLMGLDVVARVAHRIESSFVESVETGAFGRKRAALVEGLDLVMKLAESSDPFALEMTPEIANFVEGRASIPPPYRAVVPQEPAAIEQPGPGALPEHNAQEPDHFVNVDARSLGSLTNVAGELLVRHEQLERSLLDIERIAGNTLSIVSRTTRAHTGVLVDQEILKTRRDLLPQLQALSRELLSTLKRARDEQFESRLYLSTLQEEVRTLRMVRVSELFARHARALRELAKEQGKQVRVTIEGRDVTVDKQVLDHIDEPLLHLTRNAVDHALETPAERQRLGKPERGEIRLTAREVGGHVEISVSDDGRGIDLERVRSIAIERGFVSADEAALLDPKRLSHLLFLPGFSTRDRADEVSGRGVGLDVVSIQIGELGGSVEVETRPGLGTTFTARCPISVAFAKGLVVKSAGELYAFPASSVVEVLAVPASEVEQVGSSRSIRYQGNRVRLVQLAEVLGVAAEWPLDELRVVVVRGSSLLAFAVEQVVGEREAVRKNLNPFLSGLTFVSGTATVEGRQLVLFLHLAELIRLAELPSEPAMRSSPAEPVAQRKRILVVDDSSLTRDMLAGLLSRLGYRLDQAHDGADALSSMERRLPDLVLTDLDMPVMDGFVLIERIRSTPRLANLPVIVFSTRSNDVDRQRALKLGADEYIVKSAFRADHLQGLLVDYITQGRQEDQLATAHR